MIIGYARVSTVEQNIQLQTERLKEGGAEKLFEEHYSGANADNRPELQRCLEFVREGDTLIVTRLDRIARSSKDLHAILDLLKRKGVEFRCILQPEVDTSTATGKLMLGILGTIAEFENDLRRERQREGIQAAKAKGKYLGRKAIIAPDRVRELHQTGLGPAAIAKQLGCHRQSVYRLLKMP